MWNKPRSSNHVLPEQQHWYPPSSENKSSLDPSSHFMLPDAFSVFHIFSWSPEIWVLPSICWSLPHQNHWWSSYFQIQRYLSNIIFLLLLIHRSWFDRSHLRLPCLCPKLFSSYANHSFSVSREGSTSSSSVFGVFLEYVFLHWLSVFGWSCQLLSLSAAIADSIIPFCPLTFSLHLQFLVRYFQLDHNLNLPRNELLTFFSLSQGLFASYSKSLTSYWILFPFTSCS